MERQQLENQRVEHWSLLYTVTVTIYGPNAYAFIAGERHKCYPTGNKDEPWTTNIALAKFPNGGESHAI